MPARSPSASGAPRARPTPAPPGSEYSSRRPSRFGAPAYSNSNTDTGGELAQQPYSNAYPNANGAPRTRTTRSSYPSFLSLPETARLQLGWAWRGFVDASRWDGVLALVLEDAEVRTNVFKSLLVNGLALAFIHIYNFLLAPLLNGASSSGRGAHRHVSWVYQALWLVPLVSASLYFNTRWCDLVAKRTYALHHGARNAPASSRSSSSGVRAGTYNTLLTSLATSAYRIAMLSTSLGVSFALGYVPVIGRFAEFAFFCWIDAYYCFEFLWIGRSYSLAQRVRHLEERWAFYFGFGLPATFLCWWGTPLTNTTLFAMALPCYIIMAMKGNPVPQYPYSPIDPTTSPTGQERLPSPIIPIRLRIFAPIMFLDDWLVRLISFIGSSGSSQFPVSPISARGRGGARTPAGGQRGYGRRRGASVSAENAENMEAGGVGVGAWGRTGEEMISRAARKNLTATGGPAHSDDLANWKRQ